MVALFIVARLLRTGDGRRWLGVGVVLGVGLETKYTILALRLALPSGSSPRADAISSPPGRGWAR